MSDMVERVARAIEAESNYVISQHHAKALARAAIEALREPTNEMMAEAEVKVKSLMCFAEKERSPSYIAWQAMIDAALAEKP